MKFKFWRALKLRRIILGLLPETTYNYKEVVSAITLLGCNLVLRSRLFISYKKKSQEIKKKEINPKIAKCPVPLAVELAAPSLIN